MSAPCSAWGLPRSSHLASGTAFSDNVTTTAPCRDVASQVQGKRRFFFFLVRRAVTQKKKTNITTNRDNSPQTKKHSWGPCRKKRGRVGSTLGMRLTKIRCERYTREMWRGWWSMFEVWGASRTRGSAFSFGGGAKTSNRSVSQPTRDAI